LKHYLKAMNKSKMKNKKWDKNKGHR